MRQRMLLAVSAICALLSGAALAGNVNGRVAPGQPVPDAPPLHLWVGDDGIARCYEFGSARNPNAGFGDPAFPRSLLGFVWHEVGTPRNRPGNAAPQGRIWTRCAPQRVGAPYVAPGHGDDLLRGETLTRWQVR